MNQIIAYSWQTASNWADSFEVLLEAYEQIGEQLPLLAKYESMFAQNPRMIDVLALMYMDILEFHEHALRFFSGKGTERSCTYLDDFR